jgi:large subunit ribosomal protein L23
MSDPRDVILRPVVSEKSLGLVDLHPERRAYTFVVAPKSNKTEIRHAVESIFGVEVVKVTTLNRKGKRKRNRGKATFTERPTTKRAVVTLAEGQEIALFSEN